MSKFVTAIAGSAEGIKLQRAKNTATAAQLAQEVLINTKRSQVQALDARLTQLLDIGPDTADSLRPVARDFDAASWVSNVQDVKVALKKAQDHLDVALATNAEWFSETTTSQTSH